MTATTAIPDAVRIGFAFNLGTRTLLNDWGTAAIMSTSFGCVDNPYCLDTSPFNLNKSTNFQLKFCRQTLANNDND